MKQIKTYWQRITADLEEQAKSIDQSKLSDQQKKGLESLDNLNLTNEQWVTLEIGNQEQLKQLFNKYPGLKEFHGFCKYAQKTSGFFTS